MSDLILSLANVLAWPIVALITLGYIWRIDGLGKLSKITDAAQDVRKSVAELVNARDQLETTVVKVTTANGLINDLTGHISQLEDRITDVMVNVSSVSDQIAKLEFAPQPAASLSATDKNQENWFQDIERVWDITVNNISEKFGHLDKRSVAAEAYRFAHGNRKDRISYELADQIGVLHSSIKSYRRRKSSSELWLTQAMRDDFVSACQKIDAEILA